MENNPKTAPEVTPEISSSPSPSEEGIPSTEDAPAPTPQRESKTLWYVGGGIVILALFGLLYAARQKSKPTTLLTQQPVVQQPTLSQKPTLPRSKAPGVIANVLTASSLDAQGNAVAPATTFAKTEKNIYLVLTLNKPKVGTKVEYLRYVNGKLLDSNATKLSKPNLTTTSFIWSLKKPGATHVVGNYKVKVYANGIFEKEISYIVQK